MKEVYAMCSKFGELDIQEIKERVVALCEEMKLPMREVYVSADFQEKVYQVEVELFKDYPSLEELLKEELLIEESLKPDFGESISVNIVSVDEE